MICKYLVIGGGIAGVTCAETLSSLSPHDEIVLVTASKLIKAVTNFQKVSRTLEQFDVEERHMSSMETGCPNVKVLQRSVTSLDADKHEIHTSDGTVIKYQFICICTGGTPKVISADNPYVIGIRDTESVQEFQKRLRQARRIVVVGNGGIATELVYEIEGCEVVWAIKDKSITSTFIDAGAAQFCLPHLNEEKQHTNDPLKRLKYMEQASDENNGASTSGTRGSALGPDWTVDLEMTGAQQAGHSVHVEYRVEVSRLLSPEEFASLGITETTQTSLKHTRLKDPWPVYVELTNKTAYGCDFVVSATGVVPNTKPFSSNNFSLAEDGGIKVNSKMQTSLADVYAAGDVCNACWDHAPHWLQMRLWSQARQMGAYAAKCMVAQSQGEDTHMDFCFEIFAHVTKFFNYKVAFTGDRSIAVTFKMIQLSLLESQRCCKFQTPNPDSAIYFVEAFYTSSHSQVPVILLGKFNAQGLGSDHELLLRVTKGEEYVKVVLQDGRLQGAILIGDTDLEETFENLILNQTDLTPFKEHLLDPNIDIEDFFD